MLILAVKPHSMVVTRLLLWFGLLAIANTCLYWTFKNSLIKLAHKQVKTRTESTCECKQKNVLLNKLFLNRNTTEKTIILFHVNFIYWAWLTQVHVFLILTFNFSYKYMIYIIENWLSETLRRLEKNQNL